MAQSAWSNFLSDAGSSIIGNHKKALLILNTQQGVATAITQPQAASLAELALNPPDARSSFAEKAKQAVLTGAASGQAVHVLEVQYNPASILFQANSTDETFKALQTQVDAIAPKQSFRPPAITLSMELVFDAVNLKDAFSVDKLRLSANDLVSAGAAVINNTKGGYSVQTQTNAFIAMVMMDYTRNVTFQWADLSFSGEVQGASARYTMFSPSGKPIRSTVQLSISQQVQNEADTQYWNKAFDKCFGLDAPGSSRGIPQKLGSLINLQY